MITEQDLQSAIAECIGERNPNANTCIKLAAYYTIMDNLYPKEEDVLPQRYSFAAMPELPRHVEEVSYQSDTEFSEVIRGKNTDDVLAVMDELMTTLKVVIPRLYDGVLGKLKE